MNASILFISGSLRKGSYNTSLVNAFIENAPEGVTAQVADLSEIPHYSQDDEAAFPESVTTLKKQIEAADAIVIATPEYNRSIPGVLKNAIDWSSRPWGQNSWKGKTLYIVGASIGHIGTAVAQSHLKSVMTYLDMKVIGQPEFFLGVAREKFNEEGALTDEGTKEHIRSAYETILKTLQK